MTRPRFTYVVAPSKGEAIKYCRANGIKPFKWTTVLVSTPEPLRGATIRPDDVVIELEGAMTPAIELNLQVARLAGEAASKGPQL